MLHALTNKTKLQHDPSLSQPMAEPCKETYAPVSVIPTGARSQGLPEALPLGNPRGQLARLHGTYGNRAVLQMLSQSAPAIQAGLAINKPGDRFEQEADRVAEQVMRMAEPVVHRSCANCTTGGAPCPKCEGKKEKEIMRKDAGVRPTTAPPIVSKHSDISTQSAAKKNKEDCAKFPGGSTDCEINQSTGIPTGKVIQQIDETNPCAKPCVQQHEAVHVEQMKTLCPQLRDCYIAADKGKRPASDCAKMALFGSDERECAAYKVSVPCLEKRLKTAKECQSKENKEYATRKLETSEKCFLAIDCAPPPKSEDKPEKQKEKQPTIRRQVHDFGDSTGSWVADGFLSNLGPGKPLDAATRSFMEPRFGRDFSGVRIYADSSAAESARAVNARAYTLGNHVVFETGEYQPTTAAGRKLLAHELVHVAQQGENSTSIQRMAPCPASFSDPPPLGWKPYHGDSSVFHCGFSGIL